MNACMNRLQHIELCSWKHKVVAGFVVITLIKVLIVEQQKEDLTAKV